MFGGRHHGAHSGVPSGWYDAGGGDAEYDDASVVLSGAAEGAVCLPVLLERQREAAELVGLEIQREMAQLAERSAEGIGGEDRAVLQERFRQMCERTDGLLGISVRMPDGGWVYYDAVYDTGEESPWLEDGPYGRAELLSGEHIENGNRAANLQKSHFYVCPVCGNVIWAVGEGAYSCCGVTLPPLEAEAEDDAHRIHAERIETEWYVTLDHPMEKQHYIAFLALVGADRAQIVRLYPEQNAETRFFLRGHGHLYVYCNHHGLFRIRI